MVRKICFCRETLIFTPLGRRRGEDKRLFFCGGLHDVSRHYPYAVPISYVYDGGKIYFHSAKSGHKIDAIQRAAKASFCVIDKDLIVPAEYTTYFRSVIAFGQIRVIEDDGEKRAAIQKLAIKYAPKDTAANRDTAINREWKPLCMLEMTIDHITGKEAIELARERQKSNH